AGVVVLSSGFTNATNQTFVSYTGTALNSGFTTLALPPAATSSVISYVTASPNLIQLTSNSAVGSSTWTWNGSVDTKWSTTANWTLSGGASTWPYPDNNDPVVIADVSVNQPALDV